MPNPAFENVDPPYTAFRFEVILTLDSPPVGVTNPVCNAAFAECSGLEINMEPKTFRQGGDNSRQLHGIGPATYGQLTLRRGMTTNLALWQWMVSALQPGHVSRAQGQVTLWDADGTPRLSFTLTDCLPTRVAGPQLNAQNGQVAFEEVRLVYSSLTVKPAGEAGIGLSLGFSAGISAGVGLSAGVSASAGLSVSGGPGLSGSVSAGASFGGGFSLG
jgi:phage tail-like protein